MFCETGVASGMAEGKYLQDAQSLVIYLSVSAIDMVTPAAKTHSNYHQ